VANERYFSLKRISDSNIDYGFTLVDVVFIVGFVIKQLENYNRVFDKPLLKISLWWWYDSLVKRGFHRRLLALLGRKRFIEESDALFSITSVTTVKGRNLGREILKINILGKRGKFF
jgi:hypothetical protein